MDEYATWYGRREVDLGPGHIMLDGNPAPLAGKGAQHPPPFSAYVYCLSWPRSPISATAELFTVMVPVSVRVRVKFRFNKRVLIGFPDVMWYFTPGTRV